MHKHKRLVFIGKEFIELANSLDGLCDINLFVNYKQAIQMLDFLISHDVTVDIIIVDADKIISSPLRYYTRLSKYITKNGNIIFAYTNIKSINTVALNFTQKPIDKEGAKKLLEIGGAAIGHGFA